VGKTIEIMFDDLLESKKEEILKEFKIDDPKEMNWDIAPIAVIEVEMESLEGDPDESKSHSFPKSEY
jgi:hypothetical protein